MMKDYWLPLGVLVACLTLHLAALGQTPRRLVYVQEVTAPVKEGIRAQRAAELIEFPDLVEIEYEGAKSLSVHVDRLISITFVHSPVKAGPEHVVVARQRDGNLPALTVKGTIKKFGKSDKIKMRFNDDQADARELAPYTDIEAILFVQHLAGTALKLEEPKGVQGGAKDPEVAAGVHVLYFTKGVHYAAINDFGDGPYVSSGRHAKLIPGMALKVDANGAWSLNYQLLATGGPVQVDWALKVRYLDDFGKECEIPLQTSPRYVAQTKDTRDELSTIVHSGSHPAMRDHFHHIVATGVLLRQGNVLFVAERD